jgi:hypothetical protein
MAISIEFKTENSAFKGETGQHEVARILRQIAVHIQGTSPDFDGEINCGAVIFDTNGNSIGHWYLEIMPDEA